MFSAIGAITPLRGEPLRVILRPSRAGAQWVGHRGSLTSLTSFLKHGSQGLCEIMVLSTTALRVKRPGARPGAVSCDVNAHKLPQAPSMLAHSNNC